MSDIRKNFIIAIPGRLESSRLPNKLLLELGGKSIITRVLENCLKAFDKNKIILKAKKYLKKYSLKDTVDLIFEIEKINKKEIYQLCLKIKNEKDYKFTCNFIIVFLLINGKIWSWCRYNF